MQPHGCHLKSSGYSWMSVAVAGTATLRNPLRVGNKVPESRFASWARFYLGDLLKKKEVLTARFIYSFKNF